MWHGSLMQHFIRQAGSKFEKIISEINFLLKSLKEEKNYYSILYQIMDGPEEMSLQNIQVCNRCVYNQNVPGIDFDENGDCNYCKQHDEL